MNGKREPGRGDAGMALIAAMIFVSVAVVAVVAVGSRHIQQRRLADAHQDHAKAFDAMETAVALSKAQMEGAATVEGNGVIGLSGWTPVYNARKELVLPDFGASATSPVSLPVDPGTTGVTPPQILAFAVNWGKDGRDNNGDGYIDDAFEKGIRSIHAAAKYRNVTRRVEAVYAATNVNVWGNAIFAGVGSTSNVIKGNVNIGGSVHILGDNLLAGGVALEDAIDLSGNTLIQNNYHGVSDYLRYRVPSLPTVNVNGHMAETLRAKLRVKRGLVGMSGNSRIGLPYTGPNDEKQQVDGTYVTDGWSGKKTTADGGRGIPTDVYSDNGWSASYDLGDRVPFPVLSDPWRDPDTGAKVYRSGNGQPYTQEEYFTEVLLGDPAIPTDGVFTGNVNLNLGGAAFYWNATTNRFCTGPSALNESARATDDYIQFDPYMATLRMNGQIKIDGTLSFSGGGNNGTIYYSGRCAFLTTGDVNIDTSLLSCNSGQPWNWYRSFPVNNCIGIMTKTNMVLGGGSGASQLDLLGAFYAADTITSEKQTDVMGTFVSSYFDMGGQVPNIYQVPDLAGNIPLGMSGNYPVLSLVQVSWREMGVG